MTDATTDIQLETAAEEVADYEPVWSPDELLKVEELRASALQALGWSAPTEATALPLFTRESLLRYSRARPNVAAATKMLLASVQWRREFNLEQRLEDWKKDSSPEADRLRAAWKCGVHGVDKRGCPVYYARYGEMDMAEIMGDAGLDRVLAIALTEQRQIEAGLTRVAKATGTHPVQVVCVADFDQMQLRRSMRSLKPFKQLSKILDDHFPERLHVGVCVRAPGVFTGVFKLAQPFLAADTKAKVRICGHADNHTAVLGELIAIDQMPDFVGGSGGSLGGTSASLCAEETPSTAEAVALD